MIRIAAFDSSTGWGSIALLEAEDARGPILVAEAGMLARDSLASHLLSLLDRLLAESGWERASVDVWAVTRGPGSFTGVRIGLGTARGLGLSSGRPAVGVGTLEAMAEALGPAGADRLPLLDAGRGELYGARYDPESSPPVELEPPWLGPPHRAIASPRPVLAFGSGAELYRDRLRAAGVEVVRGPRAVAVGAGVIAWHRLRSGSSLDEGLEPLYLRPSDAELSR